MFALVEPCITDQLVDRPHLGCAMLVAACRARGIPTAFVSGQPRLLELLATIDPDTPIGPGAPLGVFRDLYQAAVVDGGPRAHFTGHAITQLQVVFQQITRFLMREFEAGEFGALPIVDDYVRRIVDTGCTVAGFSLQGDLDPLTREVRRRLRRDHGITVLAGGPLVTRLSRDARAGALRDEEIDYLLVGPGEGILPELLAGLAGGEAVAGVANVYTQRGSDVIGFEEILVQDLDDLAPPDFSDIAFERLVAPERLLPLETARGCSWNRCAFCDHNAGPVKRYASWSTERVVEIVRELAATYSCHEFALHDLELPPGRAARLATGLLEAGCDDLQFTALARFSRGYRRSGVLTKMRRAGFTLLEWGLESGSPPVLESMRKGTSLDDAAAILRLSHAAGIANECFVFFGFPGETAADAEATLGFLREQRAAISQCVSGVLKVQAETPLGRRPEEWGCSWSEADEDARFVGVDGDQAKSYMKKLAGMQTLDPGSVSGEAVQSVAKVNACRRLYGQLRGHGCLGPDEALAAVETKAEDDLFPLILGRVATASGRPVWSPIKTGEAPVMNLRMPPAQRILSAGEAEVFRLADGARSLADIVRETTGNGVDPELPATFLREALTIGSALAFRLRWEPSPVPAATD